VATHANTPADNKQTEINMHKMVKGMKGTPYMNVTGKQFRKNCKLADVHCVLLG